MLPPLRAAILTLAVATFIAVIAAIVPERPHVRSDSQFSFSLRDESSNGVSGRVSALSGPVFATSALPISDGARAKSGAKSHRTSVEEANQVVGYPHVQLGPLVDLPPAPGRNARQAPPAVSMKNGDTTTSAAALGTRVYYAASLSAAELKSVVRPLLTSQGTLASVDSELSRSQSFHNPGSNAVVISDSPQALGRIDALVRQLDHPPQRIVIDVFLVELTSLAAARGEPIDSRSICPQGRPVEVLRDLERNHQVKVLGQNRLELVDRQSGTVAWNKEIPRTASSSGGPLLPEPNERAPVEATLTFSPTILQSSRVRLQLEPRLARHGGSKSAGVDTVTWTTDVVVESGQTVVLRGLSDEDARDANFIPQETAAAASRPAIHPRQPIRHEVLLLVSPELAASH